ncbi:MAG: hypothetical protein J6Y16_05890 [Treponema sp.]|nr:hypothetical protein [Treponema sp.]
MTKEEALKLAEIDVSKIIHDEKEEDDYYVVDGTYQGEQIMVCDDSDKFFIGLGIGRKNYRVYKDTGKIEEFKIIVA